MFIENKEVLQEANAIIDTLERQLGSSTSEEKLIPTPTLRRMDVTIGQKTRDDWKEHEHAYLS